MKDSSDYFGVSFSSEEFENQICGLAKHFTSPQRVRILLDKFGGFKTEARDFQLQEKVFKVRLAEKPVNSNEAFLFHKTTQREMYPPIPADFDDVLLYNENDELTEFTIGNLIVEMDGELFTPSISCGLLAGTFRSYLLETGKIRERIIHKSELGLCPKLFLVNSVRKWVTIDPKGSLRQNL
jgi:para-aminobenzoate synthetase/4-amino-4-deoxychorismate lyase